jgi:general secretion pathway protein E
MNRPPAADGAEHPLLPWGFAHRHGVLLDDASPPRLNTLPGFSPEAIQEVQRWLGRCVELAPLAPEAWEALAERLYRTRAGSAAAHSEALPEIASEGLEAADAGLPEPTELLDPRDEGPVVRLVNALLVQAVREGASDIHIEPFESRLSVRLRVDGMLREVLSPPREVAPRIASRLKVMAGLDIAERRLPQDGRISLRIGGRAVDVRVSTIPSGVAERVVLRLLDKDAERRSLASLGIEPEALTRLEWLLRRPHGVLLITGPTGSGKTTTLYAALDGLNDRTRSILTVEDPIEYLIDGIGQTQVNTRIDMSFARGLRAILRQDPDVVMVGEIRDLETAEIAVQASLTGHLVLSTLHTNSAIGAVTRLRDMGVEPFLLASSITGVVAQRLVRLLCTACREPHTVTGAEAALLGLSADQPQALYRARGCEACRGSGYRGRSAVFEVVVIDEALRTLIHAGASEAELEAAARQQATGLLTAGSAAVVAGRTSLEEWLRVSAL